MNVGNHGIRSPSLQGLMMEITKNRPSIYALCKCRPLERRCWRVLNPTQTDQQKRRKATHTPACYTRREGKLRTWLSYSFAIHFLPQSWHPHLRKTKCVHYHNNNENLYTQSKYNTSQNAYTFITTNENLYTQSIIPFVLWHCYWHVTL
jgi:hypothetical protein